jgi:hypothetical protein
MPKTPGPPRLRSFYLPLKRRALSLAHAAQTSVLTSWKEIAQYIGKGARSAQRWNESWDSSCGECNTVGNPACWLFPQRLMHGCNLSVFLVSSRAQRNLNERRCSGL